MKIQPEHYAHMKTAMAPILAAMPCASEYAATCAKTPKDADMRHRWDAFYHAGLTRYACDVLYAYAHDTHIDTALRQIVKECCP